MNTPKITGIMPRRDGLFQFKVSLNGAVGGGMVASISRQSLQTLQSEQYPHARHTSAKKYLIPNNGKQNALMDVVFHNLLPTRPHPRIPPPIPPPSCPRSDTLCTVAHHTFFWCSTEYAKNAVPFSRTCTRIRGRR